MNPLRRLLPATVAIELFTHRLCGPLVAGFSVRAECRHPARRHGDRGCLRRYHLDLFDIVFLFLPAESSAAKFRAKSRGNRPRLPR
jgi:hypothetical protein